MPDIIFDPHWTEKIPNCVCNSCKTPLEPGYLGIVVGVDERDPSDVLSFFTGEYDAIMCHICGAQTGFTRTLVFAVADDDIRIIVPGNVPGREVAIHAIKEKMSIKGKNGLPILVDICKNTSEAAGIYARASHHRLQILTTAIGKGVSFVRENLKYLTPNTLLLGKIAGYGVLPGIRLGTPDGPINLEEFQSDIEELQAKVWFAATLEADKKVRNPKSDLPTYEELLETYVDKSLATPIAIAHYQTLVDECFRSLKSRIGKIPHVLEYLVEATNATLYSQHPEDNPNRKEWADQYFRLEIATGIREDVETRKALAISSERARATLAVANAADVFNALVISDDETSAQLDRIAKELGFEGLRTMSIRDSFRITGFEAQSVQALTAPIKKMCETHSMDLPTALGLMELLLRHLTSPSDEHHPTHQAIELTAVAEDLLDYFGRTPTNSAEANCWLCSHLKELGLPQLAFNRIGDEQGEELTLALPLRLKLWTERGNALRLLGRSYEALTIYQRIFASITDEVSDSDRRVAQRNVAILLRDTGSLLDSLTMLQSILTELESSSVDMRERLDTLDSICVTLRILGRNDDIIESALKGQSLSTGPLTEFASKFNLHLAAAFASIGQYEAASKRLLSMTHPAAVSSAASELSIWLNLYANVQIASQDQVVRIQLLRSQLPEAITFFSEAKDRMRLGGALLVLAQYEEYLGDSKTDRFWQDYVKVCQEFDLPVSPEALITMAKYAYQEGNIAIARQLLTEVPKQLSRRIGGSGSVSELLSSGASLETALSRLGKIIFTSKIEWEDVRMFAEMSRDSTWRSQIYREDDQDAFEQLEWLLNEGIGTNILKTLKPRRGSILVVEWTQFDGNLVCFSTRIDAHGNSCSQFWDPSPHCLREVGDAFHNRVSNWTSLYPDEPFDFQEWREVEAWFHKQVAQTLEPDGHIVIIEHENSKGIPFHIMSGEQWTLSYTSSWSQLLLSQNSAPRTYSSDIGVGIALQYGDGAEIVESACSSLMATLLLCQEKGLEMTSFTDENFDQDGFKLLLNSCEVVKVICHGFVNQDREVAFIVSHAGKHPPRSSTLTTRGGRMHKVTLDFLGTQSQCPRVIFSAACSSGSSHIGGVGDKVGVYSILRKAGLKALISPRWDIEPKIVLPILDDAIEKFLTAGMTLSQALQSASVRGAESCPKWLAWSLALEGDWSITMIGDNQNG